MRNMRINPEHAAKHRKHNKNAAEKNGKCVGRSLPNDNKISLTIKFAKIPNSIVTEFLRKNSGFGQFSVNFPPPRSPPKRKFYQYCRFGVPEWETHLLPLLVLTPSGAQCRYKPVLVIIFLANTGDFPEVITSAGAKISRNFCPSVLVLVTFHAPSAEHADDQRKQKRKKRKIGKGGFVRGWLWVTGIEQLKIASMYFKGKVRWGTPNFRDLLEQQDRETRCRDPVANIGKAAKRQPSEPPPKGGRKIGAARHLSRNILSLSFL